MTRSRMVLGLLVGLVAACSAGSSPSEEPGALQLTYSCGGTFSFTASLFDVPGSAERGADPLALALRAAISREGVGLLPESGWYLVGRDAASASFVAPTAADPSFAHLDLELTNNAWRAVSWGQCRPRLLLAGLNAATWQIDTDAPTPRPADRVLHVLVTEVECASGQSSEGRLRGPFIEYGETAVLIAFAVARLPGDQDCQGNPPTSLDVVLAEPIGDRIVLDSAVLPYHDPRVEWP